MAVQIVAVIAASTIIIATADALVSTTKSEPAVRAAWS